MDKESKRVCPVEHAGSLESRFRRLLHNPKKILSPHVKPGMSALDFGCGPGLFALEMAKLVGSEGKVVAADLQQEMLDRLKAKLAGTELESTIKLHKTSENKIGLNEKFDFILAFYVVHETPNTENFFREIKSLMKPNAKFLVVEPNFHVSKKEFEETLSIANSVGLKLVEQPKIFLSRSALLQL
ncbi:MAG: class I SAM-dependent methyltransferase [Candidatus Diapherotrites archaeon]|nr:class I SAM-dependent methyltransferase [Candidatus Diapherotrites archaeon]